MNVRQHSTPRPSDIALPPTFSVYVRGLEAMVQQYDEFRSAQPTPRTEPEPEQPTLAEDLLLLLMQPGSGAIAGEGTLFYTLAGAVLTELGFAQNVRTGSGLSGGATVEAVADRRPADPLLRTAWEYVAGKPRGVQTVLAAMGPTLRQPLLERLTDRGDVRRVQRRSLGLFTRSALVVGQNGRRDRLLADVRAVLVDKADRGPRVEALAALLYASGTLPQFDRDIPWTSAMVARAEELTAGNWGADAAANAVTRTVNATIVNSVVASASAMQRR